MIKHSMDMSEHKHKHKHKHIMIKHSMDMSEHKPRRLKVQFSASTLNGQHWRRAF